MSEEREAKQQFLREEILDKGFSASAFMDKCEREKGSDVDKWTMDELKSAVAEFKKEIAKEAKTQRFSAPKDAANESSLFPASFSGLEIAKDVGDDHLYTVSCQTLGDTELSAVSGVSITVLE